MIQFIKKMFERKAETVTVPMGGGSPVWSTWDTGKAISEGYYANAWVYACANIRANAFAAAQWLVESWSPGEDAWVEDTTHELYKLIERPNARISFGQMLRIASLHKDLGGNAYWYKSRAGGGNGKVLELLPILPDYITPITNGMTVLGFKYNPYGGQSATKTFPVSDVIHMMHMDPASLTVGAPILKSIARTVDSDREAEQWQKVSMQNRGVPDGMLRVNQHIDPLQRQRLVEQMRTDWTGRQNARAPFIGSDNLEWVPFAQTPAELDFIQSRQFNREGICAAFSVPMPMVGDYNKATLANIETARKIFWLDTMMPLLEIMEGDLNAQLVQPEYGNDVRIRYDLTNVDAIQENRREKIEAARGLWSMGVPFNDINTTLELGFEEIEGGAVGYLQAGLLPTNMDFSLGFQSAPEESELDAKSLGEMAYGTRTIRQ